MDAEIIKRMGDSVGKPFIFGDEIGGRNLPVYQMGAGSEGKSIYTIGENIGAGVVHKTSDEGST